MRSSGGTHLFLTAGEIERLSSEVLEETVLRMAYESVLTWKVRVCLDDKKADGGMRVEDGRNFSLHEVSLVYVSSAHYHELREKGYSKHDGVTLRKIET